MLQAENFIPTILYPEGFRRDLTELKLVPVQEPVRPGVQGFPVPGARQVPVPGAGLSGT